MSWYFLFFFFSGFCSVLYELVWLRMAMAQFGVTTAMVSIVLSVFMCGMGLGSWASGVWLRRRSDGNQIPVLRLYATIELLIGVSGLVVPYELQWGRGMIEHLGVTSSAAYYIAAGLWVTCTLVPWCALMGATIPVAMRAIAQAIPNQAGRSFSYLYMANVAGATVGTVLPLFIIELLGFRATLEIGTMCNGLIALSAIYLSQRKTEEATIKDPRPIAKADASLASVSTRRIPLLLLFLTGLTSMGMEVVWVRQFTPYLGTVVYAFASILAVYLLATLAGSRVYRKWSARHENEGPIVWTLLAFAALLPLVTASPDVVLAKEFRVLLGVMPFTSLLGFITPMLVDRFSAGDPGKAGSAYAINVAGCIAGPLLAGFGLLPYVSERWALIALSLPWLVMGLWPAWRSSRLPERVAAYSLLPLVGMLILAGKAYDQRFSEREVLRDSTATVIATGTGMRKELLVNGYGMTVLTPITKTMAHLPLAFLDRPPQDALDICFGMGTTFRSLHSWGIPTTVVELVPSVPQLFGYYHGDGPEILKSPLSHVVVDDGRRYLERTTKQFDVITIDPPPPIEAAGSSLLYSVEFYAAAKKRLRPGGILQQWLPDGDAKVVTAITRAITDSFPNTRAFYDQFGIHFLASDRRLPERSAAELALRLPPSAAADFVEWGPNPTAEGQFEMLLRQEVSLERLLAQSPSTPAMHDDLPVNEYYTLRRWLQKLQGKRGPRHRIINPKLIVTSPAFSLLFSR